MRVKDESLRERLLECAQTLIDQEGVDALKIRSLAERAHVSTGTVYNYFSNKEELLLALTRHFWILALDDLRQQGYGSDFLEQVRALYLFLKLRLEQGALGYMSAISQNHASGEDHMQKMLYLYEKEVVLMLQKDSKACAVLDDELTAEKLAHCVMSRLMLCLQKPDEDFSFFLLCLKRILRSS